MRQKRRGILPELHIVDVLRKRASSPATADAEHTLHGLGHLEIRYVSGLAGLFRAAQAQGQALIADERSDEQEYAPADRSSYSRRWTSHRSYSYRERETFQSPRSVKNLKKQLEPVPLRLPIAKVGSGPDCSAAVKRKKNRGSFSALKPSRRRNR